ncbi:hypothetical protein [Pseudomonas tolaasii]|uniref:hypothetical protein n=1 Tax=Pseudomonas tolaasii TaxID=29442 RepID=UPI0012FD719F|nr:hypothetical protein [Pseudomonas tolaasii]QXQ16666.1 hypothetical protein I7845_17335 [Pseudomonas tolaasii]
MNGLGWAMGVCALCKIESELKNSHLIPAAAYQHVRGKKESGGGSPIRIDGGTRSAFQSDKQITQFLLCSNCENLLSKNGENIISKLWWTHGGFPLLDKMKLESVVGGVDEFLVHTHSNLDARDREGLFYFAVSIFWRAHVWNWSGQTDPYKKALGDKYEKEIRYFLLGAGLLSDARLFVHINTNSEFCSMIRLPGVFREGGSTHHSFSILGIDFWLYLGGSISDELKNLSNDKMLFASSDFAKTNSLNILAKFMRTKITRRGKLAKNGRGGSIA